MDYEEGTMISGADRHPGHVRCHQDLLFPRPKSQITLQIPYLDFSAPTGCSSNDLPLPYREIGTRVVASPALTESVLINPRIPMPPGFH
jgi:hypothetical protein